MDFPGVPRGSTVHVEAGAVSRSVAPETSARLRFAADLPSEWLAAPPCGFSGPSPEKNRSEGIGCENHGDMLRPGNQT